MPLSHRSTYYDAPDNGCRYNDGFIYRVAKILLGIAIFTSLRLDSA
jgi:hypothetical protein